MGNDAKMHIWVMMRCSYNAFFGSACAIVRDGGDNWCMQVSHNVCIKPVQSVFMCFTRGKKNRRAAFTRLRSEVRVL